MYYISTRDAALRCTASQAIVQGLSRDGGLFLPERIPALEQGALEKMKTMPYAERAVQVMKLYLEEFTEDELRTYAGSAYGPDKFDTPAVAPLKRLDGGTAVLELWHGPTCAFKDMALQMLPYLLTASLKKTVRQRSKITDVVNR